MVSKPRNRARLNGRGANLFKRDHAKQLAKTFHFFIKQRLKCFRCAVT
ncbi:Uncharacterised protein [Vibrio cholerae]|uniref:Uncharacterized protein n=1 Tax=Vibrio cholerae TaxID=666 RepID=A0A655U4M5_VIBCL|nr:Uncharacterised protein [Vibrio cholerae]CSC34315.1 Uncharacterised protein [Vibrio cholerae]CSD03988.1 Uncharacterised protein [Vibrio cholerae]